MLSLFFFTGSFWKPFLPSPSSSPIWRQIHSKQCWKVQRTWQQYCQTSANHYRHSIKNNQVCALCSYSYVTLKYIRVYNWKIIFFPIRRATLPLDVPALCRQLQENYMSTDSTDEEVTDAPGPSNRLRVRPLPSKQNNSRTSRASTRWRHARDPQQPFNWKLDCKNLLHLLWISEDSEPFRLVEFFTRKDVLYSIPKEKDKLIKDFDELEEVPLYFAHPTNWCMPGCIIYLSLLN